MSTINLSVNLYAISFYMYDEDGNELLNEDGTIKLFRLKDSIRFKPLEYLCEDLDADYLEEIKG